jgi:tRNA nucleotidyltransferase (CCA-adding enzyme)
MEENTTRVLTLESEKQDLKGNLWVVSKKYGTTESKLAVGYDKEVKVYKNFEIEIPPQVAKVCQEIAGLGGVVLLEGGSVRDLIISKELGLDLKPKDFDFEVFGIEPELLISVLEKVFKSGSINLAGKSFGVIKVRDQTSSQDFDFSIPRTDRKTGEGHKGFLVSSDPSMTIVEAAIRRDLTMNCLAYDPINKTLFDPFDGISDIKNKTIEVTNIETFQEDPLRVMRIVQFSSRFGFAVSQETTELCKKMVERGDLDTLPRERMTEELKKLLLKGKAPSVGLNFALETGIVQRNWPELFCLVGLNQEKKWHPEGDVWTHTLQVVNAATEIAEREQLDEEQKLVLMLASLCHDFGKASTSKLVDGDWTSYGHEGAGVEPINKFFSKFSFSNEIKNQVIALVVDHLNPKTNWTNRQAGNPAKSINRLSNRLAEGGTSIKMVLLLIEADERGRNGTGDNPLGIEELTDYGEFKLWLEENAKKLNVESGKPEALLSGKDLLEKTGQKKGGVWVGVVTKCVYQDQLDGKIKDKENALEKGIEYYRLFLELLTEESSRSNISIDQAWKNLSGLRDPRSYLQ